MNQKNLFSCIVDMPYGRTAPCQLFDAAKNSREFVQKLQLQRKIPVHDGCVNSICWNDSGKYLLSGSDDQHLSIVRGNDYKVLAYIPTGHTANIFSAKFLPNTGDKHVVSCSGDGILIFSDLERPQTSLNNKFSCHKKTAYEVMTVPNDPNTFLSCGEDQSVRWFDLRTKTSCAKEDCKDDILIHCQSPVTSLAVNPLTPYQLALGSADASVRLYDRRMLCTQNCLGFCTNHGSKALMTRFTVPDFVQSRRITSLCYSADGQEMLVSYSSDYIYLFDIRDNLEKKPRFLSAASSSNDSNSDSSSRERPFMKRLRIRGDWSDTGPNARPEAESREEGDPTTPRTNIVRTMTNILSRMLNTSQGSTGADASHSSSTSSQSDDADADAEAVSDSNDEETEAHAAAGASGSNENHSDVSSKRKQEPETGSDTSNQSPVAKSQCMNKTEITNPSASSSFVEDNPTNDSYSATTSSHTEIATDDILDNVNKSESSASGSNANNTNEQMLCEMSNDSDFENIGKKLESRRKDLIEKHNSEPMVNLHYSGQSVSSGQITMDVANSTIAGEKQWIEQSLSDLPELSGDVSNQEQFVEVGYFRSDQIMMDVANSSIAGEIQIIEQPVSDLPEFSADVSSQEQIAETVYSSGEPITMDVANSSIAGEIQIVEQPVSDLPEFSADASSQEQIADAVYSSGDPITMDAGHSSVSGESQRIEVSDAEFPFPMYAYRTVRLETPETQWMGHEFPPELPAALESDDPSIQIYCVENGRLALDVNNSDVAGEAQQADLPADGNSHEQPDEASNPPPETSEANETQSDLSINVADQPNEQNNPTSSNSLAIAAAYSLINPSSTPSAISRGAELMMEVDSWDMDSDEESRPSVRGSRRVSRVSSRFRNSLNNGAKASNDEIEKEESEMSFVSQPRIKRKFTGHRNSRTMIKESTFWGDNFVMSGSDCGHIFIWDRHTTDLVMLMEADHHVVNCLQPHPFDPILASSGIDYDIKLWAPTREEPFFDEEKARELIKRNEIMLEETKDTITVPASFMFRMFTSLNYMRTGRAFRWNRATRELRSANSDSNRPSHS